MPHRKQVLRDVLLELSAGIDHVKARYAHKDFPLDTFKHFAEFMPVIVWVADPGGTVIYYNRHFYRYAGRADVSCWDLMHPADRPRIETLWNRCVEESTDYDGAVRFRDAMGEYRWHHELATAIKNERGQVTHWLGTSTDILSITGEGQAA